MNSLESEQESPIERSSFDEKKVELEQKFLV
jgi:hypothetical protein